MENYAAVYWFVDPATTSATRGMQASKRLYSDRVRRAHGARVGVASVEARCGEQAGLAPVTVRATLGAWTTQYPLERGKKLRVPQ